MSDNELRGDGIGRGLTMLQVSMRLPGDADCIVIRAWRAVRTLLAAASGLRALEQRLNKKGKC